MLTDLITTLTDWIPWPWLQHTTEILIYMGLMMGLAVAPLIAWLVYVNVFPAEKAS